MLKGLILLLYSLLNIFSETFLNINFSASTFRSYCQITLALFFTVLSNVVSNNTWRHWVKSGHSRALHLPFSPHSLFHSINYFELLLGAKLCPWCSEDNNSWEDMLWLPWSLQPSLGKHFYSWWHTWMPWAVDMHFLDEKLEIEIISIGSFHQPTNFQGYRNDRRGSSPFLTSFFSSKPNYVIPPFICQKGRSFFFFFFQDTSDFLKLLLGETLLLLPYLYYDPQENIF